MEGNSRVKRYTCSSYLPTFKDGVREIRQEFCDATILAGGKRFKCHKIILAACSRYFFSIFVQNFNERQAEEIRLPSEVDAAAMETLLDYFYSGELVVSQENVDSVFRATDYMRLDSLLEICLEFMHETLDTSNCLHRYVISDSIQYSSPRLEAFKEASSVLTVQEVAKLSGTVNEDFLSLNVDLVKKILKSSSEPVNSKFSYIALMKWIGHDEENRKQFLYELLQTISVDGLSSDFLNTTIKTEELLRRDPKCILWLLDNSILQNLALFGPRNPLDSLFISDRKFCRGRCYHVKVQDGSQKYLQTCPESKWFSAFSYKRRLYLFCGYGSEKACQLGGPLESWADCQFDLDFGRLHPGCVVLDDNLFVIGGAGRRTAMTLDTCVKFNLILGRGENFPAMNEKRFQPGTAVYANSLYAAFGQSGLPTIERIDAREGRWFNVTRYETKIGQCSSATLIDNMYICDELNGTIERFDFRTNSSQGVCSLSKPDCRKWIASVETNLFGCDGNEIFRYEPTMDRWNTFCDVPGVRVPIIVPWT